MNITFSLISIVFLLVASAFFSGSETALTAVSKARMHHLANEGSRRASYVNALIAQQERLLGSVLLGNNFVNILASALATSVALSIFAEGGVVIATLVMTGIVLIFAEVLPKTFAIPACARAHPLANRCGCTVCCRTHARSSGHAELSSELVDGSARRDSRRH